MPQQRDHISVCICTYKRPEMLANLLMHLTDQKTEGLFTYSIVIVDNDYTQSGEDSVNSFKQKSAIHIEYYCEPERNIALARNKAVQSAKGDFLALIDDDEFPGDNWLFVLYKACKKYHADGVLGPVTPYFEKNPPKWVVKGKFFDKGQHDTGHVLKWQDTRTSNVLIARTVFANEENLFKREFGRGGEDIDFFKRAIDKRYLFIWCKEAAIYETIPPERCKRMYMLKRALLRGMLTVGYSSFGLVDIIKSTIAIPIYTIALPVAFLVGHHYFIHLLIRHFEHCGRFLGVCGVDVIKQYYVAK